MSVWQWEHQGKHWIYDLKTDSMITNPDKITSGKFEVDTEREAKCKATSIAQAKGDNPSKWQSNWYRVNDGSFMKNAYEAKHGNYEREQLHLKFLHTELDSKHRVSSLECYKTGEKYHVNSFPNTAIFYLEKAIELDNWDNDDGVDYDLLTRQLLAQCSLIVRDKIRALNIYRKALSIRTGISEDWEPGSENTVAFFDQCIEQGKWKDKKSELKIRFKLGLLFEQLGKADSAAHTYHMAIHYYIA